MMRKVCLFAVLVAVAFGASQSALRMQMHLRGLHTEEEIERAFVARSSPDSPLFRQHLSVQELTALVGAPASRVERVERALRAMGARNIKTTTTRNVVDCEIPAEAAAAFGFDPSGANFRKSVQVPAALRNDVRIAVAAKGQMKRAPRAQSSSGFPGMVQTPQEIMTRYKVPAGRQAVPNANFTQGVAEFQQSFFKQSDIATFSQHFNLPRPTVLVSGPNSPSPDDTEGTLDVEYITAVSGAVTTWWVSHNAFDFTQWCEQLVSLGAKMPKVVSISWGQGDFAYYSDEAVLRSDNEQFRNLGLMGVSVFAASGDSGPGARGYTSCSKFMPGWPASSPYVTTVGATYANAAAEGEVAVSFSGGGFSNIFGTPEWQRAAVANYVANATNMPRSSFYNASGRAYPDVSALGTNFAIFAPSQYNPTGPSQWEEVSGTSCASPTFAAVISRINAERMMAGKSSLGFLNPALYRLGKVGFDVTSGQSIDTNCFGIIQEKGFPASAGWDAVSGLGTPDYTFLKAHL